MKNLLLVTLMIIISATCFPQKGKWKKAQKANTIESYQEFLRNYPESEFFNAANLKLIELEFNKAKKVNTIDGYKYFLDEYGENSFTEEVKNNLIECEFYKAKNKNTISAYKEFLRKYPDSEFSNSAKYSISKIDFQTSKRINTIESYQQYIEKYPNNKFTKEASNLLEELEFDNAQKINSVTAYESYILQYPDGVRAKEAEKSINEIRERENELKEWKKISKNPTLEAYFHFLDQFPKSKMEPSKIMLNEISKRARYTGNYLNSIQLTYKISSNSDEIRFGGQIKILEKGLRLQAKPKASLRQTSYLLLLYGADDGTLEVNVYQNNFELNLKYFSGRGYVLINIDGKMKIWDLSSMEN